MRPLQILIVSDDPERRREVGDMLRAAGHRPVEASNAGTASEALAVPGLDLVLLDLHAPELDLAGLRNAVGAPAAVAPDSLDDAERRHIAATLRHTGGNKRQAALLLGISRSTLLNKVRRYHLDR